MKKYEELCFFDVLAPIQGLLDQGRCWVNKEGLIESRLATDHKSPWLYGKFIETHNRDCGLWSVFMFRHYRIIPRGCMNCWKVMVHPRNLDEAFAMLKIQKEKFNIPAKTGMEQREYSGNYGGWTSAWYCSPEGGLKGARETCACVKEAIREEFGDDGPEAVLKRGCTEMEKEAGPSDKWKYPLTTKVKEQMIKAVFVPPWNHPHPRMLEVHIERKWIEWAAAHGDLTYLKYCEEPIITPLVSYQESEHKNEDFEVLKGEENDRNERPNDCKCEEGKTCTCSGGDKGDAGGKLPEGIVLV